MGNRAIIICKPAKGDKCVPYMYLHWSGGPESVYAFLVYMRGKMKGREDAEYGFARTTQTIGNFFGGILSLGVGACTVADARNGSMASGMDNGCYLVDFGKFIVSGRWVWDYKNDKPIKMTDAEMLAEGKEAALHDYAVGVSYKGKPCWTILEQIAFHGDLGLAETDYDNPADPRRMPPKVRERVRFRSTGSRRSINV